jgi:hypothetical protein
VIFVGHGHAGSKNTGAEGILQTTPENSGANAESRHAVDTFPGRAERVKDAVEDILERFPQTRSDRRRLWLFVIKYHYLPPQLRVWIPDSLLDTWPSPETVMRAARRIQNDEERYGPDDTAQTVRGAEQQNWRGWAVNAKDKPIVKD